MLLFNNAKPRKLKIVHQITSDLTPATLEVITSYFLILCHMDLEERNSNLFPCRSSLTCGKLFGLAYLFSPFFYIIVRCRYYKVWPFCSNQMTTFSYIPLAIDGGFSRDDRSVHKIHFVIIAYNPFITNLVC